MPKLPTNVGASPAIPVPRKSKHLTIPDALRCSVLSFNSLEGSFTEEDLTTPSQDTENEPLYQSVISLRMDHSNQVILAKNHSNL